MMRSTSNMQDERRDFTTASERQATINFAQAYANGVPDTGGAWGAWG